jgi:hypothetical protein
MAAQVVAAVGLLKLREWGRLLAIWLQVLTIVNAVMLFGIPANRAKFQQIMETTNASMKPSLHETAPFFVFPAWLGFVTSLPILLVILWFLFTRKSAFVCASQEAAPQI